jgi:hypothetical protein
MSLMIELMEKTTKSSSNANEKREAYPTLRMKVRFKSDANLSTPEGIVPLGVWENIYVLIQSVVEPQRVHQWHAVCKKHPINNSGITE